MELCCCGRWRSRRGLCSARAPQKQKKSTTSPTPCDEWLFAWDPDLQLARRWKATAPGVLWYSLPIAVDDSANELAPVKARWADDVTWDVPDMTVGQWGAQRRASATRAEEPLYRATHVKTMHKITLKQRTDRVLLLSVYEQGRQIAQVRADVFGELPQPQPGCAPSAHPTIQKGTAFLTRYVDSYADDSIQGPSMLKEKIKEGLASHGWASSSSRARALAPNKKPAANADQQQAAQPTLDEETNDNDVVALTSNDAADQFNECAARGHEAAPWVSIIEDMPSPFEDELASPAVAHILGG